MNSENRFSTQPLHLKNIEQKADAAKSATMIFYVRLLLILLISISVSYAEDKKTVVQHVHPKCAQLLCASPLNWLVGIRHFMGNIPAFSPRYYIKVSRKIDFIDHLLWELSAKHDYVETAALGWVDTDGTLRDVIISIGKRDRIPAKTVYEMFQILHSVMTDDEVTIPEVKIFQFRHTHPDHYSDGDEYGSSRFSDADNRFAAQAREFIDSSPLKHAHFESQIIYEGTFAPLAKRSYVIPPKRENRPQELTSNQTRQFSKKTRVFRLYLDSSIKRIY